MEFAPRTYRMTNRGRISSISIETVDDGALVKITIENNEEINNNISIELPKEVAICIRDHLDKYLSD